MRCPISSPIEIQARFELRRADGELQPQKRGSQSHRQEEEFLGVGHRGSVSERSPDRSPGGVYQVPHGHAGLGVAGYWSSFTSAGGCVLSDPLEAARLKAEKTYNAAADCFDAEPLAFWARSGRRTAQPPPERPG